MAGHLMGGATATLLDQCCGMLFSSAHRGATASLALQYTAPVPLPAVVVAKARVDRVERRKVFITARLERWAAATFPDERPMPTDGGTREQSGSGLAESSEPEPVRRLAEAEVELELCAEAEALFIARREG